jgi:hypothetical protein
MASRNFSIKVYVHKNINDVVTEDRTLSTTIGASDEDSARVKVAEYLKANRLRVLGISHGPRDSIIARATRETATKGVL